MHFKGYSQFKLIIGLFTDIYVYDTSMLWQTEKKTDGQAVANMKLSKQFEF